MKRIISMLLILGILLTAACGSNGATELNETDDASQFAFEDQTMPTGDSNMANIDAECSTKSYEAQTIPTGDGDPSDIDVEDSLQSGAEANDLPEVVSGTLGQSIDDYLSKNDYWGTALVVKENDILLRKAYGMADAELNIENTIGTPFYIASVTKQFAGAAILTLEAENKLSPEDTLDKFFSGYSGLENVTVADLLTMKGGFGDRWDYIIELIVAGEDELIKSLTAKEIETYILTNWGGRKLDSPRYSNSDYYLLGRIVEQVSRMTFEEYVKERLFMPAGMTNSGFAGTFETAMPHNDDKEFFGGSDLMQYPFSVTYSSGGIISTVDDLNLWLDAYLAASCFLNPCWRE